MKSAMKDVVNRGDGTLAIKKMRTKAEIRKEMYYTLEKINRLEEKVQIGKMAENELLSLEEDFKKLCELSLKEEEQW